MTDWLRTDDGDILTTDEGMYLSADSVNIPLAAVPGRPRYLLDVCNNFERIGSCDVFSFAGTLLRNATGEWLAEIPEGGIEFDADATIADVDSIMLWEAGVPARIVYAGAMVSTGSVPAGLIVERQPSGNRWKLSGVDLFGVLGTRLAYPTPATEPPWADAYDSRTGPASTVAAGYIEANAGSTAIAARQIVGVETVDPGVGDSVTWTARLQPLSTLITSVCNAADIVCRATMPTPGVIRYLMTTGADKTSQTILSDLDLSDRFEVSTVTARATYVVAGGSGAEASRTFGTAAVSGDGLDRVESFYDVSNLTGSGAVGLAAQGQLLESSSETAVRFGRLVNDRYRYPTSFDIGDTITVEAGRVRYPVLVEGVAFTINPTVSEIRPITGRTTNNEAAQIMRQLWGTAARFNTNIT